MCARGCFDSWLFAIEDRGGPLIEELEDLGPDVLVEVEIPLEELDNDAP
jgi:hypothetical protein